MPTDRVRVALGDDSYLMREAVAHVLEKLDGIEVVAICPDGDSLLEAVVRERAEVVVTDLRMPPSGDQEGIRVARELRETHPHVGVVVLSQFAEPEYGLALLAPGAEGRAYLLKDRVHSAEQLRSAIDIVADGGSVVDPQMVTILLKDDERHRQSPLAQLTPREREVLAAMAEGKSNASIAETLVLTKRAVEKHVGVIFQKLGLADEKVVSRRVFAVLLFLADERRV
jgi:DNA-binding NarL/FixJ family response regulator